MTNAPLLVPYQEKLFNRIKSSFTVECNSSLSDFSLNCDNNGSLSFRSHSTIIHGINFFDTRDHLCTDLSFALSAANLLGLSENEIIQGVKAITSDDLRQRFIVLRDFTIFDDSYNASQESILADLKYLSSLNCYKGAFLGDVLELGENAAGIHKAIGENVAASKIDRLYLLGKYAHYTAEGAIEGGMPKSSVFVNTDTSRPDISIHHIISNHLPNEMILFKASHKMRLDKLADEILEKERTEYGE